MKPSGRRGYLLVFLMVGSLMLATSMFLAQTRHLTGLAARQRALITQARRSDLPGRLGAVPPSEPIPVGTPAARWLDIPSPEVSPPSFDR